MGPVWCDDSSHCKRKMDKVQKHDMLKRHSNIRLRCFGPKARQLKHPPNCFAPGLNHLPKTSPQIGLGSNMNLQLRSSQQKKKKKKKKKNAYTFTQMHTSSVHMCLCIYVCFAMITVEVEGLCGVESEVGV